MIFFFQFMLNMNNFNVFRPFLYACVEIIKVCSQKNRGLIPTSFPVTVLCSVFVMHQIWVSATRLIYTAKLGNFYEF